LFGWLAVNDGTVNTTYYYNTSSPYEIWETRAFRFNAGTGTGTIREFGLTDQYGNSQMSMRTLISPAVVKAADQVLDVYYKFWIYQDITDTTGVVSIAGEDYNYIVRGDTMGVAANRSTLTEFRVDTDTFATKAYTGDLGPVTGNPSSPIGIYDYASITEIGNGSGYHDYTLKWALDDGNDPLGIRSIHFDHGFNGISSTGYQCSFSRVSDGARIPKDNTKELTFTFRMNWARH
jgi:hypothetical protein